MSYLMSLCFFAIGMVYCFKANLFYAFIAFLISSLYNIAAGISYSKTEKKNDMTEVYKNIVTQIEDNIYENK